MKVIHCETFGPHSRSAVSPPNEGFHILTSLHRDRLDSTLRCVHKAGVYHGDFEPRNIVVRKGKPVLIDFSHSLYHGCPGDNCDLLEHTCDVLGPKTNDIGTCQAIFERK